MKKIILLTLLTVGCGDKQDDTSTEVVETTEDTTTEDTTTEDTSVSTDPQDTASTEDTTTSGE